MQDTMLIKQVNPVNQHVRRNLQSKHWFYESTACGDADAGYYVDPQQVNPLKLLA